MIKCDLISPAVEAEESMSMWRVIIGLPSSKDISQQVSGQASPMQ